MTYDQNLCSECGIPHHECICKNVENISSEVQKKDNINRNDVRQRPYGFEDRMLQTRKD